MKIPFNKLLLAGTAVGLLAPTASFAQSNDGSGFQIEEIVVTARKREESLQEVPVSISVIGAQLLSDAGIVDQRDLFEMTPGIHYDEVFDRNAAQASVRGVQSNEVATNRTKVTQFIDGMPVLGSQGSQSFGAAQQIEIFRGPQSAAFGRSTFGGAVNIITKDPTEEFEGDIGIDVNDYGRRMINGAISGPINDKLGYRIDANIEDSSALDEWVSNEGIEYGARSGESLSAKFAFTPTDSLSAELTFSHTETDDGPSTTYFLSQEARDACFDGTLTTGRGGGVSNTGTFNCDWSQGNSIISQNDREAVLRAQGVTDEGILTVARGLSVPLEDVGSQSERDRLALQVDIDLENGALVQLQGFTGKETYIRHYDESNTVDFAIDISRNPVTGLVDFNTGMGTTIGTIMSDPSEINETYLEARWVSPGEDRLRYVVGASYYKYDFVTDKYFDNGYGAILGGFTDEFQALTGIDQVTADLSVIAEDAENIGVFFNASYDISDKATVTLEARYQSDDVGAVDSTSGNAGSVKTTGLLPRLSFNYNASDDQSFYVQLAKGNNPGGINTDYLNPNFTDTLDNGVPDADGNLIRYVDYDSSTYVAFEEEELINFEIGTKGVALDNRLQYAAAVFYMDWSNQASSVNLNWDNPLAINPADQTDNTGSRTFLNGGDLDMKGIEFEATYFVTDNFNIRATGSYLDAQYSEGFCDVAAIGGGLDIISGLPILTPENDGVVSTCVDIAGNEVAATPPISFSLSPSYQGEFASGLRWNTRADFRYEGSEYLDSTNVRESNSVLTVNASFGVNADNWNAALYVNNVLDEDEPTRFVGAGTDYSITTDTLGLGPDNFQSNYIVTPRAPRTIGLRVGYNF